MEEHRFVRYDKPKFEGNQRPTDSQVIEYLKNNFKYQELGETTDVLTRPIGVATK